MAQMDEILTAYLNTYPAHHETIERWPIQGEMRVRLSLAGSLPPAHVSSSILAIVLKDAGQEVLYLWPGHQSGSISHLLIGGRPETGETPEETATREVGEETGWRIKPVRMIGFRHFFQLEPRSPESDRPYPDFIQPVYAASAVAFEPGLLVPGDRIPAEFIDLATVERATEPAQRPLLDAAIEQMRAGVTTARV